MKNLEQRVMRFLDGEMSPSEETAFRGELQMSLEARTLLREMTILRRGARRLPVLHTPSYTVHRRLFERLQGEGYRASPSPIAPAWRRSASRFAGAMVAALLLVIGASLLPEPEDDPGQMAWNVPLPGVPGQLLTSVPPTGVSATPRRQYAAAVVIRPDGFGEARVGLNPGAHDSAPIQRQGGIHPNAPSFSDSLPRDSGLLRDDGALRAHGGGAESSPDRLPDPSQAPIVDPPGVQAPDRMEDHKRPLLATLQGGVSRMNRGDGMVIRDMQVRLGREVWEGGLLSVVVGAYPSVTETRHSNTSFMLSSAAGARRALASAPPSTHRIMLEDEVWGGLALRQRVATVEGVEIEVGGGAGSSRSAFRMVGDVAISRHIGDRFTFEAGATLTQTLPYDQRVEHFQVFDSPDNFVYNGASQRPAFYSIGLQAGARVAIGK